jgi:uncharacterized Tic20 family protein
MSDTPPPPPAQPAPQAPLSASDERLYATLGHAGIIIVGFIAPLIVWLIGKERSEFVDDQGKEALNFSILLTIVYVVGWITSIIFIGFLLVLAAFVISLIFCIQGAMAANKGERYRYPFNWRIIK